MYRTALQRMLPVVLLVVLQGEILGVLPAVLLEEVQEVVLQLLQHQLTVAHRVSLTVTVNQLQPLE